MQIVCDATRVRGYYEQGAIAIRMKPLGVAIRDLRGRLGLTQSEFGEQINTDQTLVSSRERGRSQVPHVEIERMVAATGVALVVTPDGWAIYDPPQSDAPYYGPVPCGRPLLVEEAAPEQVDLGDLTEGDWREGQTYMVRADGRSMEPTIRDGDWMVVRRGHETPTWGILVIIVDGETTVAQVQPDMDAEDGKRLGKINPSFGVPITDESDVQVIGQVVGLMRYQSLR